MAKPNALPKYAEYVFPTLKAVKGRGGSATIEEIEDGVAELLKLSDAALSIPHGETGQTEFQYKLAWVRTYLKKYGALDNSERGVWSITDKGERVTEAEAREVFKKVQSQRKEIAPPPSREAEEIEAELPVQTWIERTLSALGTMHPQAFERLCQRLLRESGFIKVEVTGKPSDGGIDGIGVLRMNLVSFQVLFQCKRWKGPVGASVVRDFRGAMVGRADKGLIITTGTFTSDARREATRDGAPAIDLIDGENLCFLLKDRKLGVHIRLVEEISVDERFFQSI
ncbi:restriction endonuclease [Bosea sp. (in: a-proteobacteria)]|uniref:restriction endonuclease n=1 Tax=Bosea sp. (in: a-proteobacteria) TaxID=1871050 RepID=UPI003564F3D5